ncbi:MAG: TMEM165/GDT1 family protein [Candidatus Omnitrophota bacterium]|nr:TMEM165/GDT1 family protein [Candidatus Omnitrophota bacterium]
MTAFVASFMLVLLAEMGDKTQLLAMAFAAKYSIQKVLIAIFLATLLCNAIAVIAGQILITIVPIKVISLIAALSFIIFGLWTLKKDKIKDEDKKRSGLGPIATVGIAFLLAEMGDKTQLATMSLSIKYRDMFSVLMGATLAMLAANIIGIIVGSVMRKHVPEKAIKWFSAIVFILFGIISAYRVLIQEGA